MTNREWIVSLIRKAADELENGAIAETLLRLSRSDLNESGFLYDFWCDGCGNCGDPNDMCSDEAQLDCIRRFLERPMGA